MFKTVTLFSVEVYIILWSVVYKGLVLHCGYECVLGGRLLAWVQILASPLTMLP